MQLSIRGPCLDEAGSTIQLYLQGSANSKFYRVLRPAIGLGILGHLLPALVHVGTHWRH